MKRLATWLVCCVAVIALAKTLAIELQYQYNARRILLPSRIPPPSRRQVLPVRVLRVSRQASPGGQV